MYNYNLEIIVFVLKHHGRCLFKEGEYVTDTDCLLFILWCYCDFSVIAFYDGDFQQVCGSFSVWEQFLWEIHKITMC